MGHLLVVEWRIEDGGWQELEAALRELAVVG